MFLSIGKRYSLKYDIEKFYDSIYTHYLPAGLVGFSEALNMYRGNKEKSEEYNYMFKIDCDMRNLCNAETKGILTGPYTSRIFSELLQSEIDKEIFNSINNNSMRRFVDDTEIYSYTKEEQERNLENIKKILQKYKLAMKMEKTKIIKFPFIDFSTLRDLINIRFIKNKKKIGWYFACQDDLFEVLNKADKMTQAGNKGTFKYILKVLNGKNFEYGINENYEEKDASFFYLLNYITIYPQYSKEILDLLNVNIQYIDNSQEILNQTLKKFIKNGLDLACLFLIQLMLKNKIDIEEEIMDEYLNSENNNEILRATIINYLCEKNIDKKYDKKLLNEVEKLKIDKKINFSTENWLAKYILYYYNFFEDKDCVEINNFLDNFKQYKNNNIKFIDFNLL